MIYTINLCTRNQSNGSLTRQDITDNVANAFSFVEKLDESLDVGSMVVRNLTTGTPYSMFDSIEVKIGTDVIYSQRIAGDSVALISKNPLRYEHTLSLVEHTKILERFQISGKTFTQPTDGTVRYYLLDVLQILIDTTPLELVGNLSGTRVCKLPTSGDLFDFLSSKVSPEFTFKDTTLREAIADVCIYVDAIPRLYLNSSDELELTLDFINELKNLITSNYIDIKTTQNIDLYATQLESEVLNVVNDESIGESLEIHPSMGGYISARTDGYIFDFTKSYIPTPKPIYNVQHCYVRCELIVRNTSTDEYYYGSIGVPEQADIDIATRIVEFNKFKTFKYIPSGTNYGRTDTVFYEYRKPNIQIGATYGLFDTQISLTNVITRAIKDKLVADGVLTELETAFVQVGYLSSEEDFVYQTHYVPLPISQRLNIDRQDLSDVSYNSVILNNQQSRLVNLDNYTSNMQARINRIGNSELQLDFRASSYEDLPNIGDYTNDLYIVTVKETIYFKDYVYCKLLLSKNYNMISKFIGVNSEIRQWEIGEQNTLNRNLIYKEYIEIDAVESGVGSSTSDLLTLDGITTFMETLVPTSTYEPIRSGIIIDSQIPDDALVSLSSNGGGNSLIFNWKFVDNKSIGAFREDVTVGSLVQSANNFASYTNDTGLLTYFELRMFDKVNQGDTTLANYLSTGNNYPKMSSTTINKTLISTDTDFVLYKDSREIIGGTVQLQMISSDNNKVGLGRYFSLRNRLVSENPPTAIRLYASTTKTFGRTDTINLPTGYTLQTGTGISSSPSFRRITITSSGDFTSWTSYCLTDENDRILLWVNNNNVQLDVITFAFNNKRSGIDYKY